MATCYKGDKQDAEIQHTDGVARGCFLERRYSVDSGSKSWSQPCGWPGECCRQRAGGPSVVPVTEGWHEGRCWQWERQAVRGSAGRGKVCLILSATVGNDEMTRILKIGQEISGKFYVRGGPELRLFEALKPRKEYLAYFHLPVIKNKNTKCTT